MLFYAIIADIFCQEADGFAGTLVLRNMVAADTQKRRMSAGFCAGS